MTRYITDAYLYGWHPGNPSTDIDDADYVFPGPNIEMVDLAERVGDLKDTARVSIQNLDGEFSGTIRHGDRVQFEVRIEPEELRNYGTGVYGRGIYSPTTEVRWVGLVRNHTITANGRNRYEITFDAEDFGYAIMGMRRVTNAWEDEHIVGGEQGIINTILRNECPELDASQLPNWPETTTTISLADANVLEAIAELANRAGAILYARGKQLYLVDPEQITAEFAVTPDDYYVYSVSSNDDALYNTVRVEGGQSHALHSEHTTQNDWATVTSNSRYIEQITNFRKSEVDRVAIWTDPNRTGAEEDLIVRLQKDDGGAPVAVGNNKSDIARKKLSHEFLTRGGFTTFIIPDHTLPEPNPWLIVESSGEVGHDIGIDTAGTSSDTTDDVLTHRAFYPYPVRVERQNRSSQQTYREREYTMSDDEIRNLSEAREVGNTYLDRHDVPDRTIEVDVDSPRMHDLEPGDVVRVDFTEADVSGRYVCVERSMSWEETIEEGSVTLRNLASV